MQTGFFAMKKPTSQTFATPHRSYFCSKSENALVREALRQHLRRLEILALEEQEREGYRRIPQDLAEFQVWEAVAWPED